jgi:hypothetical protein
MFYGKVHEQTIPEISQGDQVSATADSFLIDPQAKELSRHTLKHGWFLSDTQQEEL